MSEQSTWRVSWFCPLATKFAFEALMETRRLKSWAKSNNLPTIYTFDDVLNLAEEYGREAGIRREALEAILKHNFAMFFDEQSPIETS